MSAEELHQLLARLHAELQGAPQLDAESRQRLQELGADLARLGQGGGTPAGGVAGGGVSGAGVCGGGVGRQVEAKVEVEVEKAVHRSW